MQRCFNLASTLVKAILNPIGLVMIMDLQIHEWFLFFEMRKDFLLYMNNSTTNKTSKIFLTVVRVVIHNGGNNGDKHKNLKCCIQNLFEKLKAERKAHST